MKNDTTIAVSSVDKEKDQHGNENGCCASTLFTITPCIRNNAGILCALLASVFVCLSGAIVKLLSRINPVTTLFIRYVIHLLFAVPVLAWKRGNVEPSTTQTKLLILLHGLFGFVFQLSLLFAVVSLPFADVVTIYTSNPVVVMIISAVLLKEKFGFLRIVVVVLMATGIILTIRPAFLFASHSSINDLHTWGVVAAVTANVFSAAYMVILRKLKSVFYLLNFTVFSAMTVVGSALLLPFIDVTYPENTREWVLVVASGVFSVVGYLLVTKAFQLQEAGPVSVSRSVNIVTSYIIQVALFDTVPHYLSVIGALLIVATVFVIAFEDYLREKAGKCWVLQGKKQKYVVNSDI